MYEFFSKGHPQKLEVPLKCHFGHHWSNLGAPEKDFESFRGSRAMLHYNYADEYHCAHA